MLKDSGSTWKASDQDYLQVFHEQNPWHETGEVPDAWARKVERPLANALWQRLLHDDPHRFQIILGPRRVGKTTTMYQTVKRLHQSGISSDRLWWLRLDHPLLMQIRLDVLLKSIIKLAKATTAQPVFLFLDELTYAKEWDLWLKTFYDESWPVRIAGSSSSTAALRNRRIESGVGRWEEQYLAPYLFGEYLSLTGQQIEVPVRDSLSETISACIESKISARNLEGPRRKLLLTGGFPELLIRGSDAASDETSLLLQSQRILRSDAVERAVYKDIPQAFGRVENPMMLERVLYTLAGQVTGLLSPQNLCQGLDGLARQTFERYFTYLERAFLVFSLANYSGNESSKQKRGRKIYFVDGAVRNAALQRGISPLNDPDEMGLLIENQAAGHLHTLSQQGQVRLYHWRDKNDEVDLIYDQPEYPLAFEIASSNSHSRGGLHQLVQRFPKFKENCYIVSPISPSIHPRNSPDQIGTVPLDVFLLAVSAQAERELSLSLC
ncbi:MAG TPA: ATP-binding protein [Tepidisphaeraceae bacterium]|nr:ATP-binding protein [Tepidisphaeraceae bacterium]